jgi:Fe-S cluster assembly iron-binding protein IscA
MVILTDQAAQVLRATLDETRTEPGQALRLLLRPGGGFGLGVDQEREGDQVVTAEGEKILLMTPDIAEALGEATIDAPETEEGRKLVISRR